MSDDKNNYLHHLDKVCSDYSMTGSDIYTLLINQNDEDFPLSFETVKYMVLKELSVDAIKLVFTLEELKSIYSNINIKKIKNKETRNFITHL